MCFSDSCRALLALSGPSKTPARATSRVKSPTTNTHRSRPHPPPEAAQFNAFFLASRCAHAKKNPLQYRFWLISSEGELDRIVTRAYEPRPVSDRDIERAMSHLEDRWKRMGAPPSNLVQLVQQQHFNAFFPAFQALYEGPSGTTWVQKPKPPSEMAEGEALWFTWPSDWAAQGWDVFDSEGRYLGVIAMPLRFTPSVFRGERIYGVALDELGVPSVVRLRVVRTGLGSGNPA